MRHGFRGRRFNRTAEHREALADLVVHLLYAVDREHYLIDFLFVGAGCPPTADLSSTLSTTNSAIHLFY